MMRDELSKADIRVNRPRVEANLEISPQKRPLAKAQAMFFKGLKEAGGNDAKVSPS